MNTQNNDRTKPLPDEVDAVVVGAGFAGLYMVHLLRDEMRLSVRGFDAAGDVGGTWYWNRYPGARCDIESYSYSYSFSPELQQEWNWSERFAGQPEVLAYLGHVADRFDLRRSFTFDTRVIRMEFDDGSRRWHVHTDDGRETVAQFVVCGTGNLSLGRFPDFPGRDDFQGRSILTSQWPHEGVDFTGRRVAVIGTGSTGVQLVPHIGKQAAALTVFQRTPAYAVPLRNRPLPSAEMDAIKARYPEIRKHEWDFIAGIIFEDVRPRALDDTPEERRRFYEQKWAEGGFTLWLGAYDDIVIDPAANDTVSEFVREKIHAQVKDPETAEKLTPRSYPFGTKRETLEIGYYETFNRDSVRLVDIKETPITRITRTGIQTTAESLEFDDIIYATGFDAFTGALYAMDICGRGGRKLSDYWSNGPRPYLGLATHGFPNLFFITGPLSPSVLFNMPRAIEQHCDWVASCIGHLRTHGYVCVEPEVEAEDHWIGHVKEVADATLFPRAKSWYMGDNVPGKPRVFMVYLGGCSAYKKICDDVAMKDYEGFMFEA